MDYTNIKTKPASKEYRENWDKIFNKENSETKENTNELLKKDSKNKN